MLLSNHSLRCHAKYVGLAVLLVALFLPIGCGQEEATTSTVPSGADQSEASESTSAGSLPASTDPARPEAESPKPGGKSSMMPMPTPEQIVFKDRVASNAEVPEGLNGLTFVDTKGKRVELKDFIGQKNVVLVFTEGFTGMLCPFCKTQTSRLIANYKSFADLDTEILVVYPGERDHVDEFIEAARTSGKEQVDRVPFPIVLDQQMHAVDFFDIRSKLAHPSTYIIDKLGNVRLAYVGQDMSADRPSIKALLETLQDVGGEGSQ